MKQPSKKQISLKTLTKGNVWELSENDIVRLLEAVEKDAEAKENIGHFIDIAKCAFDFEEVKVDKPEVIKKYEGRGYKIMTRKNEDGSKMKMALKKRPIVRVTDLTYENIRHISAAKVLEVIDRNFGGGWDSLSQSIQDIIESGFDVSTTTLPKDRLHKTGSLYDKKIKDGFEVLEIAKGLWVEAIFVKAKPIMEPRRISDENIQNKDYDEYDEEGRNDDAIYDDDDDTFDEDKLTEESYRTTFDTDPEDLSLEDTEVADDDDY